MRTQRFPTLEQDLERDIAEVTERLATVNASLEKMPAYRRNSHWGLTCAREKQGLLAQLDRLRDQARAAVLVGQK